MEFLVTDHGSRRRPRTADAHARSSDGHHWHRSDVDGPGRSVSRWREWFIDLRVQTFRTRRSWFEDGGWADYNN